MRLSALPVLLAACGRDDGDPDGATATSPLPPLEWRNGVDDDGDGEIDEPVNMAEADVRWEGVESVARDVSPAAAPTPDLVPLDVNDVQLVPPLGLARDRREADLYDATPGWMGQPCCARYTADLDGDGLAELSVAGRDREGTVRALGWSGAGLAAHAQLPEPDFVSAPDRGYTSIYPMSDVGPLAGTGTNVACAYNAVWTLYVPIYGVEAFADGKADLLEAHTTLALPNFTDMGRTGLDFDGDGVPDLLFYGETVGVAIFSGAQLTPGEWQLLHADHRWTGVPYGFTQAGGDVTGDGLPDLFVTEWGGEEYRTTGDRTWLLDPTVADGDLETQAVSRFRIDDSGFGGTTLTVGDGDGDGHDEVVIGRYQVGSGLDYGTVYLLPGATFSEPGTHGPPEAAMTLLSDVGGIHLDMFGREMSARDLLLDGRSSLVLAGDDGVAGVFFDIAWR